MIGEGRYRRAEAGPDGRPVGQRPGRLEVRVGTAGDATPASARSRSRWIDAARPQPAIPIRSTGVPIDGPRPPPDSPAFRPTRFARPNLVPPFGYGLARRLHPSKIPALRQESIWPVNP